MSRDQDLPARSSLSSRPQAFGVLPTYWFWNDRERQRLVLPLVALVALPVTPLLFFLVARLGLSVWSLLVGSTLYPYLVMGLVERHIREELRRRRYRSGLPAPAPEMSSRPRDRALFATLAAASLLLALFASFNVDGSIMLVTLALGIAASLAAAMLPRAKRIANQLEAPGQASSAPLPPGSDNG